MEIMRELALNPMRTRKFIAHIPGLSMKSLRERLAEMEVEKLITRTEYPGRPLKVEYELTERGKKILAILEQLKEIADEGNPTCTCSIESACQRAEKSVQCPYRRPDRKGC